ncbi:MAG: hypothetical protein KC668_12965 [Myxococcales bacterium]|nr:hypothetical protein [Myxococcales bacterium]
MRLAWMSFVVVVAIGCSEPAVSRAPVSATAASPSGEGAPSDWQAEPVAHQEIPVTHPTDGRARQLAPPRHTLAVGSQFSCALRSGRVYCWGGNSDGALGVSGDQPRTRPVEVPGLRDVVSLAAARLHAAALHADGRVSCWGSDTFGRVSGVPASFGAKPPTVVPGIDDAIQVALGENHSCALRRDGSVWCWGYDRMGELGDGRLIEDGNQASPPVRVAGLPPASSIAAFGELTAAVVDGEVYFWGIGAYRIVNTGGSGSLPRAPVAPEELPPQRLEGLSRVARLVIHRHHGFALTDDGRLFALGIAPVAYGIDPDLPAPTGPRPTPRSPLEWGVSEVRGLGSVTQVATGAGHACVRLADGTVRCWGAGGSMPAAGPRGDGLVDYRLPPSTLALGADEVAAGADHVLARAGDTLWAWGSGWAGQLGQGSTESTATAVRVSFEGQ